MDSYSSCMSWTISIISSSSPARSLKSSFSGLKGTTSTSAALTASLTTGEVSAAAGGGLVYFTTWSSTSITLVAKLKSFGAEGFSSFFSSGISVWLSYGPPTDLDNAASSFKIFCRSNSTVSWMLYYVFASNWWMLMFWALFLLSFRFCYFSICMFPAR